MSKIMTFSISARQKVAQHLRRWQIMHEDVAKEAGVSLSTVRRWLSDKSDNDKVFPAARRLVYEKVRQIEMQAIHAKRESLELERIPS